MLQTQVISDKTFELLTSLMQDTKFSSFFLVGGTSIALQLGHRISIDLDLFTQTPFDTNNLFRYLTTKFGFEKHYSAKNTLNGTVDSVMLDFIRYDYPLLNPLLTENKIRLASLPDIIGMKLSAITDDGSRLKDFVDIAYLSCRYSLKQMVSFYSAKYTDRSMTPLRALSYFEDIDFEGEPVQLVSGKFEWQHIRQRIIDMIDNPNKNFEAFP